MGQRVLIVEDDGNQAELLSRFLDSCGYLTLRCASVSETLAIVDAPDFILLDLNLPDGQGIALCPLLKRRFPAAILLMLTARKDEMERILGLEIGADDYLTKPYSLREVEARMRAILRRRQVVPLPLTEPPTGESSPAKEPSSSTSLILDEASCEARIGQVRVVFTAREFRVLAWLHRHPQRIWTREQLIEHCWSDGSEVSDRVVDAMVARIRKKLDATFQRPFIFTKHGLGYGFERQA